MRNIGARNIGAIAGFSIAIMAFAGVGVAAFADMRERTLKEDRELDAAIDRIVAQQNAKRAAAKLALARAAEVQMASAHASAQDLRDAKLQDSKPQDLKAHDFRGESRDARIRIAADTTGAVARDMSEGPQIDERRTTLGRVKPRAKRQNGRSQNSVHFLPTALASVPKFAVYQLLRLR
jgi:hypothetical protein